MIQLINSLPFQVDSDSLVSLCKDWTRFQDGLVILAEIPDAIRGEFECVAEVMKQEDSNESSDNGTDESGNETDESESRPEADFDSLIPSGEGKLVLTASKLYWLSTLTASGWSIDYKNVLLHAISKPTEPSRPHIYLQLSCNKVIDSDGQEIRFDAEGDGEKFVEVNLFVKDVDVADEMFVALSECSSLHPCDSDSDSDSSEESEDLDSDSVKRSKIDMDRFEDAADN